MRQQPLSIRGAALSCGVLWGGAILLTAAINARRPAYGRRFLDLVASVYPGYTASGQPKDVLVGTAYAFTDGALAGALYALLYNRFSA